MADCDEEDWFHWLEWGTLIAAGVVCVLIAAFRGPTRSERQLRARVIEADDPGAA